MENIINKIIDDFNKSTNDYIIKTLKKYILYTGIEEVYNYIKDIDKDIDIRYSKYLSNDNKVYAFIKEDLKPVCFEYYSPVIESDPANHTVHCYSTARLVAGDYILW